MAVILAYHIILQQFPADAPEKVLEDCSSTWAATAQVGDQDGIPGS